MAGGEEIEGGVEKVSGGSRNGVFKLDGGVDGVDVGKGVATGKKCEL